MAHFQYALSSALYAPETAPILLKGSVCENLKKAGELGYDAIEIHMRETDAIDIPEVQKTMQETGVRVAMIVTGRLNTEGGLSLMDDRPYVIREAIDGMKQYIRIASALGADIIIGWMIGRIPAGALCPKQYYDRLAENLKIICSYASEQNVKINIEVINHYETNVFTTARKLMTFKREYKIENLYVHLDTFHMDLEETDFAEAIKTAGDELGYIHLADSTRLYPGSARIDFGHILKLLQEIGYKGWLSVECFPVPDGEEAARKALGHMKQIEALI